MSIVVTPHFYDFIAFLVGDVSEISVFVSVLTEAFSSTAKGGAVEVGADIVLSVLLVLWSA